MPGSTLLRAMIRAFCHCDEKLIAALILTYSGSDGMTEREIARECGLDRMTYKRQLALFRKVLKKTLAAENIDEKDLASDPEPCQQ